MKEYLFLGDSITDAFHNFDPENLGEGYVRMIAETLADRREPVRVLNKGIDGFTLPHLLRFWKNECTSLHPDRITVLIGVNDASLIECSPAGKEEALEEFKLGYRALLEQLAPARIILMEPFIFAYPAEYGAWRPLLAELSRIEQAEAKRYGLVFISLQEALDKAVREDGCDAVTTDGIHLTKEGHRILADRWLAACEKTQ